MAIQASEIATEGVERFALKPFHCLHCQCVLGIVQGKTLIVGKVVILSQATLKCSCGRIRVFRPLKVSK